MDADGCSNDVLGGVELGWARSPARRPTQQVSCIGCQGERVCVRVVCDAVRGAARLALFDRDVIASIVL